MLVPEGFVRLKDSRGILLVRDDFAGIDLEPLFTAKEPLSVDGGRGSVVRARIGATDLVLRDYRRGGMLRHMLPDIFPSPRRAFLELLVHAELQRRGVPVVRPIAALARRVPLGYRLRIATELFPGAKTLPRFCIDSPQSRGRAVRAAGAAVRKAFAAGLHHRDLHPDNVLVASLADGSLDVRLIDFDRARLVADLPTPVREAMLVRFARWLRRHARDLRVRPTRSDHLRFLAGLGLDRSGRRAAWGDLDAALARALARRGLS
ncbi:MAG: lipopolysaccharide kinase InaA family protein [Planctomycetota bacterium]